MRAMLPLLALSTLFAGCIIDVPDDHGDGHYYHDPIDATAAFTWEFYPGLSCGAADVSTVTVVIDGYHVVDEFTESCWSGTLVVDGMAPGSYHVEAFGEPGGWWTAYDVYLYEGYNDVLLQLR